MDIKKFIKDATGITAREEEKLRLKLEEQKKAEEARIKIEKANEAVQQQRVEAARKRKEKREKAAEAKLTPKELATKKGEPWVDVIEFKANKDNVRHGFFELDWNDLFVVQLKNDGYGYDGDPDEEIVGRWFRDICANAAAEEGIDMSSRPAGSLSLNIRKLPDNRSEIG